MFSLYLLERFLKAEYLLHEVVLGTLKILLSDPFFVKSSKNALRLHSGEYVTFVSCNISYRA
jgi:hypothetical protein